jgi:nucleoside-triphosphatase THEP1
MAVVMPPETDTASLLRAAATFYPAGERDHALLGRFAGELKGAGVRVGGLVQEGLFDADGRKAGIDAIELDTGRRVPINRPTKAHLMHHECSLDTQALAEATAAVRRAVAERAELIVVEKFGEQEQHGDGLADDILLAISEDIPTLIAVPRGAAGIWNQFSGGLAATLDYDRDALMAWWTAIRAAAP